MKITEEEFEEKKDLLIQDFLGITKFAELFVESKDIPKEERIQFLWKAGALDLIKGSEELSEWILRKYEKQTLLEVVEDLSDKIYLLYKMDYEIKFENFNKQLNDAHFIGKGKSELYYEETNKINLLLNEPRNEFIITLGNELVGDLPNMIDNYIELLERKTPKENRSEKDNFLMRNKSMANQFMGNHFPKDYWKSEEILQKMFERAELVGEKSRKLIEEIGEELIELHYLKIYFERLKGLKNEIDKENEFIKKSDIFWQGKNETEFVQLVYALHQLKLINNKNSEVTNIVKSLAASLNYDLGKNWESNFGKSILNRNSDYQPKIFENLELAFQKYSQERIEQKQKNKKN